MLEGFHVIDVVIDVYGMSPRVQYVLTIAVVGRGVACVYAIREGLKRRHVDATVVVVLILTDCIFVAVGNGTSSLRHSAMLRRAALGSIVAAVWHVLYSSKQPSQFGELIKLLCERGRSVAATATLMTSSPSSLAVTIGGLPV